MFRWLGPETVSNVRRRCLQSAHQAAEFLGGFARAVRDAFRFHGCASKKKLPYVKNVGGQPASSAKLSCTIKTRVVLLPAAIRLFL
tara:strand:+ start:103 stop:360 length:258 start_codon:yes stop_codon:yes gene_type:complete